MLKLKQKSIVLITGVALLATAAVWGNNLRREISGGKEVKQMTEKMVTYCVGRYLIDLPQDTIVNDGATRINNIRITFIELDLKQPPFRERLKAREEELKAEKNRAGMPFLESATDVSSAPLKGRLFQYGRTSNTLIGDDDKPYVAVSDEAELWLHGPVYEEYRLETDLIRVAQIDKIVRLARRLQPIPANQIPTEPGFCFERGIILDPPTQIQVESIVLHFKLKKYPDVVGNFFMGTNGDKLAETLLQRDAKNDINQRYASHFKPIFKGERVINGIPGEEVSEKVKEMNGTSAHSFMWDARGKVNAPFISFDISTGYGQPGNPLNSSLPDKAATELWKKISGSIRLRPTTPGKTSDATDPNNPSPATANRLPLKSKVTSAVNCPQTGIWECAADAPGITEHRRLMTAGQGMPYGVTQRPAKGLGGFLGKVDDDTVEIIWTLVGYEDKA